MRTESKVGRVVRDLPAAARPRELHRCKRCERNLGRYHVRLLRGFWQLVDGDGYFCSENRPRTGTGLSAEEYNGVRYIRVRCKCAPRNEKLRLEKYLALPVVEEREGPVVYL